eukprot:scaffold2137_cov140-Skeletonema_menzelii.AAC.11
MVRRTSSSGRRRRPMASKHQEVDAIENPTELFQRINSGDWDGALLTLHRAQAEASIWVSRWSKRNQKIAWKYLPLHLVCLHQKPPWPLLEALLQANPDAASAPTQHDGNLPIHYICESGCDDANVLTALITAFPKCMSVVNRNNKTPIMMICHPRTRSVLKKVLKQILPSEQAKLRMGSPFSNSKGRDKKSRVDQRNASEFSSRYTVSTDHHEQRQLPDNTTTDYTNPPSLQRELPEHKSTNNFDFSYSLSSDDTETCSSPSTPRNHYLSTMQTPNGKNQNSTSKPTVTQRNLYNEDYQNTTSDITGKLQKILFSAESSDMKLCDRILAKAESESVQLRAQIQQLQIQKNKLEERAQLKERSMEENLNTLITALVEQGDRSNITLFDRKDESSNPDLACVTEVVLTLLSHMELKSTEATEQVHSLQAQLSETNVKHKSALATNLALQQEKQIIIDERDNLERMLTTLERDMESLKRELSHEKETTSSLRVINQSLQEQIDAAIGELPGHERNLRSQVRCLNADLQKMKDEQKNSVESQRYQKQISSLLEEQKSMRERNQALKETIRENNEMYSRKILELEKKFEEIEQSNQKFRRNKDDREEL